MPKVRVMLFANLREIANTGKVEMEGETIRDVLEKLCSRFEELGNMIFEGSNLRPYINIFINGKDIHEGEGLNTSLHEDDEIAIFPPVSGG